MLSSTARHSQSYSGTKFGPVPWTVCLSSFRPAGDVAFQVLFEDQGYFPQEWRMIWKRNRKQNEDWGYIGVFIGSRSRGQGFSFRGFASMELRNLHSGFPRRRFGMVSGFGIPCKGCNPKSPSA